MKKTVKILIMMIVIIALAIVTTACSIPSLPTNIGGGSSTTDNLEVEEYYLEPYGYPIEIDSIGPIYGYTDWGPIRHPDYCQHSSNGTLGDYYPATCTTPETQNYNCYWCCKVVRVETLSGPKHTDLLKYDAIEPSCSPGYTYGEYCYDCEQWIVERTEIPAIHDEHVWYGEECDDSRCPFYGKEHNHPTIKNATCTKDGVSKSFCFQCNKWIVDHIIPATGHNYVDGICTNKTYEYGVCNAHDPSTCPHSSVDSNSICEDCGTKLSE